MTHTDRTKWTVLQGLPAHGPTAQQFTPSGIRTYSEGLVIDFCPSEDDSWVGNFQRGSGTCEDVLLHPNGSHVIVVAGGTAYVIDAQTRSLVNHFGRDLSAVVEVREIPAIVFFDSIRCEALGAAGVLWSSHRLSWDGVRAVRREGDKIRGEAGGVGGDDNWYPFEVDIFSGEAIGGSYNGPPT